MDERQFEALAGETLRSIERALDHSGVDADVELKEGGALELEVADGSKIIVNRHGAARQMWVAVRSCGFHCRWAAALWKDTRDGDELFAALSKPVPAQSVA